MKTLYESILSSTNAGKESLIRPIRTWLDEYGVKNYTINDKLEINLVGDVNLMRKGLKEFPSFIQFGVVKGNFFCDLNRLTTLKGSPIEVGKVFDCSYNRLVSLEGAPFRVKYFDCSSNKLASLEGAPRKSNFFNCKNNTTKFSKGDVMKVCNVEKDIYV